MEQLTDRQQSTAGLLAFSKRLIERAPTYPAFSMERAAGIWNYFSAIRVMREGKWYRFLCMLSFRFRGNEATEEEDMLASLSFHVFAYKSSHTWTIPDDKYKPDEDQTSEEERFKKEEL